MSDDFFNYDSVTILFERLLDSVGCDVMGYTLTCLTKSVLEGKLDNDKRSMVKEALSEMFAHYSEKQQGPYR